MLPKGEFICILGPSGAGKSTLLNLLGGMDRPTSGDIIIDKENISKKSDKELTKYRAENVGFIFQFYNILPTLTVLENVEIVNDIVKKPKSNEYTSLEKELTEYYGTKVKIANKKLIISFENNQDLNRILEMINYNK